MNSDGTYVSVISYTEKIETIRTNRDLLPFSQIVTKALFVPILSSCDRVVIVPNYRPAAYTVMYVCGQGGDIRNVK